MVVENNSLGGQPIKVGRFDPGIAIGTQKAQVKAVANDDDDIHGPNRIGSRFGMPEPNRSIVGHRAEGRAVRGKGQSVNLGAMGGHAQELLAGGWVP